MRLTNEQREQVITLRRKRRHEENMKALETMDLSRLMPDEQQDKSPK